MDKKQLKIHKGMDGFYSVFMEPHGVCMASRMRQYKEAYMVVKAVKQVLDILHVDYEK